MIDGIIKDNGTSRLMRANLPATYEEFREAVAAGTQALDILFNAAGWSQLPDFLNKANLLKDATAMAYGLTAAAVPDDVLSILGKYSQHWWKRRSTQTLPTPSASTGIYLSNSYSSGARVIYYSDSAIVNADGSVSLVNEQTTTVKSSESTGFPNCIVLRGKYIRNAYSPSNSSIYFIPEDATFTQETSPNYAVTVEGYLVKAETVVGEWEFLQSPDRNAYPDSGESGVYEYQYLGIPFDNAVTVPKVATGSYTGTGTYGISNPCSLTFEFAPKMIMIFGKLDNADNAYFGFWIQGSSGMPIFISRAGSSSDGGVSYGQNASLSENTFSWYNRYGSAQISLNASGQLYSYIAIG